MQTIIMTVGTSLLTNADRTLPEASKRPWLGQTTIGDRDRACAWMNQTDPELISAEVNTLWHLGPDRQDQIILLYTDTASGLECAEVTKDFLNQSQLFDQQSITLRKLPGINYGLDQSSSALEQMAQLLEKLVNQAIGAVTLAATGGFKAQTMIMGIVGNSLGIPVCYIHEEFQGLVYLPYLYNSQPALIQNANLPASSTNRSSVIQVRSDAQEPHRPRIWQKAQRMLPEIAWIEQVYYDERAYSAPVNGVKGSTLKTQDGCNIIWMHLRENNLKMAVAIETTGYTPEHLNQSARELRERLGRLL